MNNTAKTVEAVVDAITTWDDVERGEHVQRARSAQAKCVRLQVGCGRSGGAGLAIGYVVLSGWAGGREPEERGVHTSYLDARNLTLAAEIRLCA